MSLSHIQLFFNPIDCSLLGSSAHGIYLARILEWVAISFPRGSSPRGSLPRDQTWSLESSALAGGFFATEPPGKSLNFLSGIKQAALIRVPFRSLPWCLQTHPPRPPSADGIPVSLWALRWSVGAPSRFLWPFLTGSSRVPYEQACGNG